MAKDLLKEQTRIGHTILWTKGHYTHSGNTPEDVMNDLRQVMKFDGYDTSLMTDDDIYRVIFAAYDEIHNYAYAKGVRGFNLPVSSIVSGTMHLIFKKYGFKFCMLLEIFNKFSMMSDEDFKLPSPFKFTKMILIDEENGIQYELNIQE